MEHNHHPRENEPYFENAKVINNFEDSTIIVDSNEHREPKWDNDMPNYFRDHSWREHKHDSDHKWIELKHEHERKRDERPLLRGEHEAPRPEDRQNNHY